MTEVDGAWRAARLSRVRGLLLGLALATDQQSERGPLRATVTTQPPKV